MSVRKVTADLGLDCEKVRAVCMVNERIMRFDGQSVIIDTIVLQIIR